MAIGLSIPRIDGPAKVAGVARYAADHYPDGVAHGYLVPATIARGRIVSIDASAAQTMPGVIDILTHENMDRLNPLSLYVTPLDPMGASGQQVRLPMQDDRIVHDLEYVALVLADTYEAAQEAGLRIVVEYEAEEAVQFDYERTEAHTPVETIFGTLEGEYTRGDPDVAMAESAVRIEGTFDTPILHHNPIELHATLAQWDGDRLDVREPTQWVLGIRNGLAETFGLRPDDVRVRSEYVGGGFGGKGLLAPHTILAVAAARRLGRPVRLVITRALEFSAVGFRARTHTEAALGGTRDGRINAITMHMLAETPVFQDVAFEPGVLAPRHMYANEHMRADLALHACNIPAPVPMRAPGEASGMFVLESLVNDYAAEIGMDPVEVRRINRAERNPENGLPWSSNMLMESYDRGAEMFGWADYTPEVGSMTRDGKLIGWGMASATYPMIRTISAARLRAYPDGRVQVACAAHDIGTGMYTVCAQVAADTLGIDPSGVEVLLGDTNLPIAPAAVAAQSTASVGTAVQAAARSLRQQLDLGGVGGSIGEAVRRTGRASVEAMSETRPGDEYTRYSMYAFGANFVEVEVDPITLWAQPTRLVGVYAGGKVVNPTTARSQIIGGAVFAIGMAMTEHTIRDPRNGRTANPDLGLYHMPVQADMPEMRFEFLEETDPHVNPLGAKGLGELGGVGLQAAITDAMRHATGRRVRYLPYTPEALFA